MKKAKTKANKKAIKYILKKDLFQNIKNSQKLRCKSHDEINLEESNKDKLISGFGNHGNNYNSNKAVREDLIKQIKGIVQKGGNNLFEKFDSFGGSNHYLNKNQGNKQRSSSSGLNSQFFINLGSEYSGELSKPATIKSNTSQIKAQTFQDLSSSI